MKRVWNLYRVSTKGQVNSDDDIPMQKKACHNFADKQGDWKITNELFERGVSGWSKSADERDALNTIREAAVNKEFDILLVFMFDRLGRREDETPFVINFLHQNNVEVWSVQEGKRKMDSHVDKLINYISSWQSSGESIKTSLRVRESKKQLSEQGYFQGGKPPYGYKIVETDQTHWKDKERKIKELVPDDNEAMIIKLIFDLYVTKHYGYRKIADFLNGNGYKNRNNTLFRISLIQRILSNSIYIGLKRYKSFDGQENDTQPYNEKLRIVSDAMYEKAQEIRNKKKSSLNSQDRESIPLAGKLMCSGFAYCYYCNSKLSGNYLYRKNQKPHNKEEYYINKIYRYRCPLNKGKVAEEHMKNIWGAKKFDEMVIEQTKAMMKMIDIDEYRDRSINKKVESIQRKENNLQLMKSDNKKLLMQLDKLNSEIANALMGESSFTPDQLSSAIENLKNKIETNKASIEKLENEISFERDNYNDIEIKVNEYSNWEEKFDNADSDTKKAMLSRAVKKVYFMQEDVKIKFDWILEELLKEIVWS
jgi:site-specific DNA recombinase